MWSIARCFLTVSLVEGWVSVVVPPAPPINGPSGRIISPIHQFQASRPGTARFLSSSSEQQLSFTGGEEEPEMGLNELQTLLRNAAKREDYMEAGRLSDMLVRRLSGGKDKDWTEEQFRQKRYRMSWQGLGTAPWLEDRLDALNYTFPTTIQINAMEAVNAILDVPEDVVATTTLEERMEFNSNNNDMGVVISGNTGSGKTLAYLTPILSTLSDSLFVRQRLRVGAEERILGDKTSDFVARVMAVTSPELRSTSTKTRQGGSATGAALSTLGRSGTDVRHPLVLIVVPTKELGVQIATLLYQLVGGTIRKKAASFVGKASMFKYKGPKGVKIGCVLDDEDAQEGLKLQTDVAITMPQYLTKLLIDGDVQPSRLRVIVYDEADLALEQTNPDDLEALFNDDPEEREFSRNVSGKGKSDAAVLASQESTIASLQDLDVCMDPGLRHSRVIAGDNTKLLTLTKLLRKELDAFEEAQEEGDETVQRPRVVVFFPTEEEARAAIEPIRDALWNKHQVCVLLPKTGFDPARIMEEFTDGKTNLMIATPNSMGSAKGSGGRVIAVLKQDEASKMDELAKNLGFEFTDIELDEDDGMIMSGDDDENEMDVEKMRRYLEDTLTLVTLTDDPSPIPAPTSGNSEYTFDDDDDDDDSDFGEEGFE
ncbi:DEAD-like helicase [Fragilaria crotonensis]|nr:DEAD-like helicase [Fragilaria crotonensis]